MSLPAGPLHSAEAPRAWRQGAAGLSRSALVSLASGGFRVPSISATDRGAERQL